MLLFLVILLLILLLIRTMHVENREIIRIIIVPVLMEDLDPNAETVHDTNVQDAIVQKFNKMREEMFQDLNITKLTNVHQSQSLNFINYLEPTASEKNNLTELRNTILQNEYVANLKANELEIFTIAWYHVMKHKIDKKTVLMQLAETDVCLMGRVARYVSLLDGLVEGYKGQTPVTEKIVFQEALSHVHAFLLNKLKENNLMEAYLNGEAETFVQNILPEIRAELDNYKLSDNLKNEIMTAF